MVEKIAKFDSLYEQKFQKVEEVMREQGIRIIDGLVYFEDDRVFTIGDLELRAGYAANVVVIPREVEEVRLILKEEF